MDTRLDSLFALLGKDSSAATKKAAIQQIAEVQKSHPYNLQNLLERAHYYLRDPHWETRLAASQAIEAIVAHVPLWSELVEKNKQNEPQENLNPTDPSTQHAHIGRLTLDKFNYEKVLESGKQLLASEGLEFEDADVIMSPEQLANLRQLLVEELGLSPDSLALPITDEDLAPTKDSLPKPEPEKPKELDEETKALEDALESKAVSSRMRNKVRRLQKQQTEKSQFDSSKLSSTTQTSGGNKQKTKTVLTDQPQTDDKVVLEAVLDVDRAFEDINEWPLERFCDELCNELFNKNWYIRHGAALGLRAILKRHSKSAGKRMDEPESVQIENNRAWNIDGILRLLCVLMMDRYTDYSGDFPVAHIREASAQVVAVLIANHDNHEDLNQILSITAGMIEDSDHWDVRHSGFLILKYYIAILPDFVEENIETIMPIIFSGLNDSSDNVKAVAADAILPLIKNQLYNSRVLKFKSQNNQNAQTNNNEMNIKMDVSTIPDAIKEEEVKSEFYIKEENDNFSSVQQVSNYQVDINQLPPLSRIVSAEYLSQLLQIVSGLLLNLDDVSSALSNVMILLSNLCLLFGEQPGLVVLQPIDLFPLIWPFFRHTIYAVRHSVLVMVTALMKGEALTKYEWLPSVAPTLLQLIYQNFILETEKSILDLTTDTWTVVLDHCLDINLEQAYAIPQEDGTEVQQMFLVSLITFAVPQPTLLNWFKLLSSTLGEPVPTDNLFKVESTIHAALGEDSSTGSSDRRQVDTTMIDYAASALALLVSKSSELTDLYVTFIESMMQGYTGSERLAACILMAKWASFIVSTTIGKILPAPDMPLDTETEVCLDPFYLGLPSRLWDFFLSAIATSATTQFYFTETNERIRNLRNEASVLLKIFKENGIEIGLGVPVNELDVTEAEKLFTTTFGDLITRVKDVVNPTGAATARQQLISLQTRALAGIEYIKDTQSYLNISFNASLASAITHMWYRTFPSSLQLYHNQTLSRPDWVQFILNNPSPNYSQKTLTSLNSVIKPLLRSMSLQSDFLLQTDVANSLALLIHLYYRIKMAPVDLVIRTMADYLWPNPSQLPALKFALELDRSIEEEKEKKLNNAKKKRKAPGRSAKNGKSKNKNDEDEDEDNEFYNDNDDNGDEIEEDADNNKIDPSMPPIKRAKQTESNTQNIHTTSKPSTPSISEKDMETKLLEKRGAEAWLAKLSLIMDSELLSGLPYLKNRIEEPLLAGKLKRESNVDQTILEREKSQLQTSLLLIIGISNFVCDTIKPTLLDWMQLLMYHLQKPETSERGLVSQAVASLVKRTAPHGMNTVVSLLRPLLKDPSNVYNRRGAALSLHAIIKVLDIEILPYLNFLIGPVLSRMSDQDDVVRKTISYSFATLVRLMPLEAQVPNPPNMPQELIEERIKERAFLDQLLGGRKIDTFEMPIRINTDLRAYQQDGVNWLAFLNKYHLHGILADDMGLGKTLQTICIVNSDYVHRARKFEETKSPEFQPLPCLVVCPPILVAHWENEVRKFCESDIRVVQYRGTAPQKSAILKNAYSYHIIVTSYESLRKDIEEISNLNFNYCVLDEGHIIRNNKTKITQAVKRVRANHRVILTGTPIQNNVLELWSLFDFLMPGFLGTESQFVSNYAKPVMESRDAASSSKDQERGIMALEALHRQVLPFILRRMKEDVLQDLPPKIIQDMNVELSPLQTALYIDFEKNSSPITEIKSSGGKSSGDVPTHVFQSLQYLRKLISHPKLVFTPSHPKYEEFISRYCGGKPSGLNDYIHSPKLIALRELLLSCGIGLADINKGLQIEGENVDKNATESISDSLNTPMIVQNRVLIFTQLKSMLDIVEKDLFKRFMPSVSYLRLDGDVPPDSRMPIVEKFNSNPSIDVLLLTVGVGGLGLNLTGANTVIFLEHDWNPQVDLQAMDRAHRIGQKKTVNVYRLIARGTLEEKVMSLQRFKLQIANTVVNKDNQSFKSMDTSQLFGLFHYTSESSTGQAAESTSGGLDAFGNLVGDTSTTSGELAGLGGLLSTLDELGDSSAQAEEYNLDSFLTSFKS